MKRQEFKNYNPTWMSHGGLVFCGFIAVKTDLTEAVFEFFAT